MKSLLITGATGFIGSYLIDSLIKKSDFKIIILKRSASDVFRIKNNLTSVTAYDIDNIELEKIFEAHDILGVVHLATHYAKSHSSEDIEDMLDSNVKFPTLLLEYSLNYGVNFFINTGTFFEYSTLKNPIDENSRLMPFNLYSATKSSFDSILKYYANNSSLNILTLKLAAPFGYNDNFKLMPYLINSVLNNESISIERGEQEWDFIYVKDVISAYIKAIDLCINSKRSLYEEVLIGTGKTTSIREIVSIIKRVSKKDLIKLEKDYASNQIFIASIDNSKAKNLLQWVPKYSVEDALMEMFNLYKENNE